MVLVTNNTCPLSHLDWEKQKSAERRAPALQRSRVVTHVWTGNWPTQNRHLWEPLIGWVFEGTNWTLMHHPHWPFISLLLQYNPKFDQTQNNSGPKVPKANLFSNCDVCLKCCYPNLPTLSAILFFRKPKWSKLCFITGGIIAAMFISNSIIRFAVNWSDKEHAGVMLIKITVTGARILITSALVQ